MRGERVTQSQATRSPAPRIWMSVSLAALWTQLAWGQVGAPVLGFVPDGSRIRPVFGIPAAARIAAPLPTTEGFARTVASPKQDYLLGSAMDTGAISVISPDGSLRPLTGTHSSPDLMVISPGGSAAALWFASLSHAQVLTGLPGSPQIREVDASFLGPNPYALAVSDDGQWMAGAWRSGNYAFGPNGETNRLQVEDIVSALTFFQGRQDLVVATHEQLVSITGIAGMQQVAVLVSRSHQGSAGRLDIVAVAVAESNRQVVAVNPRGKLTIASTSAADASSGATQTVDCSCSPEGLFPMGHAGFRLTGLVGGAFQIYDGDSGQIWFVPLSAGDGGQQ